ncbi:RibD family protein [Flindersiella endophytica]
MGEERDGPDRPFVVVSVGASVDGRVTLRRSSLLMHPDAGQVWAEMSPPSSGALHHEREALLEQLYHPQAVLEGSGSLVTDDAGPLDLPAVDEEPGGALHTDFLPSAIVSSPEHKKWFTIVDSRGRVFWDTKGGGGWDVLVLVSRSTPAPYLAYLRREQICYLLAGDDRVDLALALRRMRERLGVTCVVSKAGGGLNGRLLRAGLIDEFHLIVSPAIVGGLGTPTVFDGPELSVDEKPQPLRLLSARVETDGMLSLRYEVVRD